MTAATKRSATGTSALEARIKELEAAVIALRAEAGKPLRRRLSDTRTAVTHKFDIAGHEGYLTVGLFEPMASPANCSSRWPRKVRPSAV